MSIKNLLDPILEQGIRNTNFFEGRLLSGDDLRNQLDANRQHDRYLGQAVGQGIISGLEVELDNGNDGSDGKPPIVTVKKGLAINAEGEVIGLPDDDIKLALSRSIKKPVIELTDFYACAGPPSQQHVPNGAGVYILVMSPVAGYKERALKSGLGDEGIAKGCGSKYIQEGVRFHLLELTRDMLINLGSSSEEINDSIKKDFLSENNPATKNNMERLSKLRNILANLFFATEEISGFTNDILDVKEGSFFGNNTGLLQKLHDINVISSCEVPLALIYWSLNGIEFVDQWAVRRMLMRGGRSRPNFGLTVAEPVADARLRQFQAQVADLTDSSALSRFRLSELFRWLPPLGMLPIAGNGYTSGVDIDSFFEGMTISRPVFVEGGEVAGMLCDSLLASPVDVKAETMIWRYVVRENIQASNGVDSNSSVPLVLFASPVMAPYGESRYNAKYWNYGNYR